MPLAEARSVLTSAPVALEQAVLGAVTWLRAEGEWRAQGPDVP